MTTAQIPGGTGEKQVPPLRRRSGGCGRDDKSSWYGSDPDLCHRLRDAGYNPPHGWH